MIRTYGLHWSSDEVQWGHQGSGGAGQLLGYKGPRKIGNGRPRDIVDFREQKGIYALYYDFDLIYIGQTGDGNNRLLARLRSHLTDHMAERWNRFSWFGTQWVTKKNTLSADATAPPFTIVQALNVLEAVAIAIAEPRLNLQRGNWKKMEIKQFFQIGCNDEGELA